MSNGNMAEFPGDLLRATYGPVSDCPPPEKFLAAEWAALSESRRAQLAQHAEVCPACAAERELAAAYDEDEADAGADVEDLGFVVSRMRPTAQPVAPPDNVVSLPRRRYLAPIVGLAAAAFLGVALAPLLQDAIVGAPAIQGPGSGATVRSARIEVLYPIGEVDEAPTELGWVGADDAARYQVTLRRVDGRPIWQADSRQPTLVVPDAIRALMQPAVAYTWEVSAWNSDGARVSWSDEVRFRLALRPRESGPQ